MVDLTDCKQEINKFGGSENKLSLIYDNRRYMVKFPDPIRQKDNSLSYMHNVFSEDIGCKIFKVLGFDTQNTFLATYRLQSGKQKIVVACEDFTQDGGTLIEFSKLALQNVENGSVRTQAEIENIMDTLRYSNGISDRNASIARFWDMFIVDGLIQNRDRNLDNWGFIQNDDGGLNLAPIYDCGSSLSPLITEEIMRERLLNEAVFKREEYNVYSSFRHHHKRILFSEIMKNPKKELKSSILKLVPIIKDNMTKINQIIEDTPKITDIHKDYLKKGLTLRLENILLKSYKQQKALSMGFARVR